LLKIDSDNAASSITKLVNYQVCIVIMIIGCDPGKVWQQSTGAPQCCLFS